MFYGYVFMSILLHALGLISLLLGVFAFFSLLQEGWRAMLAALALVVLGAALLAGGEWADNKASAYRLPAERAAVVRLAG